MDLDDWALAAACLAGPEAPYAFGCACADADFDGDMDLADLAEFQQAFAGP